MANHKVHLLTNCIDIRPIILGFMTTTSSPLSNTAQAIAEAYAVFFPERPARSKTVQWINKARRTRGLPSIKQDQVVPAIAELVEAQLIEPPIEGQRGVAARGPGGRLGTITRFCRSAIDSGVAGGLLRELDENYSADAIKTGDTVHLSWSETDLHELTPPHSGL